MAAAGSKGLGIVDFRFSFAYGRSLSLLGRASEWVIPPERLGAARSWDGLVSGSSFFARLLPARSHFRPPRAAMASATIKTIKTTKTMKKE